MTGWFAIYCVLAAVAVAGLLAAGWSERLLDRRRWFRDETLRDKYLRILMLAMISGARKVPRFPMIRGAGSRLVLIEVIAGLVSVTYGLDATLLRRIVSAYGLDAFLLRRIRRARGCRRAYYLSLLARLPLRTPLTGIDRYAADPNRYVRFYAMMARMAADPSTALRLMAEYPQSFSAYEVSEIMTMLRRGVLPIAYEPLVESPIRNLRVVGLGIVRQFGIEEAERHLLRMVAEESACELGREALYALCAMRRPLVRREVAQCIARMNRAERRALLRYMALEGYSPRVLRRLFDPEEQPYYESLVHSYKRCLVCS